MLILLRELYVSVRLSEKGNLIDLKGSRIVDTGNGGSVRLLNSVDEAGLL